MKTLHLNLKATYFDQVGDGSKPFEYRLITPYWEKRLVGRQYDRILVKKGYPPKGDATRILERPWRGVEIHTITHEHFGPNPVRVFAIRVNPGEIVS